MDKVFNTIYFLITHFDNLLKAIEAEELMNQEINTETYQRDRCIKLRNECVKVFGILHDEFESDLIIVSHEIAIELSKRDLAGQKNLCAQLFDMLNEFRIRFNIINTSQGFSEEVIGTKFKTILEQTAEGVNEEKLMEYSFSIALLADNLSDKFNQLQATINKSFKFLNMTSISLMGNQKKDELEKPTKLTILLKLYFEKDCKFLNEQQVNKLSIDLKMKPALLKNRWGELKRGGYKHTDNSNNIKSFSESYKALIIIFQGNNEKALKHVENDYNVLKETYPDYI